MPGRARAVAVDWREERRGRRPALLARVRVLRSPAQRHHEAATPLPAALAANLLALLVHVEPALLTRSRRHVKLEAPPFGLDVPHLDVEAPSPKGPAKEADPRFACVLLARDREDCAVPSGLRVEFLLAQLDPATRANDVRREAVRAEEATDGGNVERQEDRQLVDRRLREVHPGRGAHNHRHGEPRTDKVWSRDGGPFGRRLCGKGGRANGETRIRS